MRWLNFLACKDKSLRRPTSILQTTKEFHRIVNLLVELAKSQLMLVRCTTLAELLHRTHTNNDCRTLLEIASNLYVVAEMNLCSERFDSFNRATIHNIDDSHTFADLFYQLPYLCKHELISRSKPWFVPISLCYL